MSRLEHPTNKSNSSAAWWVLHKLCMKASSSSATREDVNAALALINLYATDFYCRDCQKHFERFIRKNPIEKYINLHNGLFYWSWKAHNNADIHSGHKQISYDDAKRMYKIR